MVFKTREVPTAPAVAHSINAVSANKPKIKIARDPASDVIVIVSEVAEEIKGFPTWSFAIFETA